MPADAEVTIALRLDMLRFEKQLMVLEILIHIGIDAVSMNGEGFDQKK